MERENLLQGASHDAPFNEHIAADAQVAVIDIRK